MDASYKEKAEQLATEFISGRHVHVKTNNRENGGACQLQTSDFIVDPDHPARGVGGPALSGSLCLPAKAGC